MLTLATALLLQLPGASLSGTARAEPSGEPVAGAVVAVAGVEWRAVTDAHGYFILAGVPAGNWPVTVSAGGYESWTGRVAVGAEEVRIEPRLRPRPVRVEGPVVVAGPGGGERAGPAPAMVSAASLRATPPLAEPDLFRTVQALPAVASISDISSGLYVRGGSPDQTLVTLDGIPLFNPYHLAGIVSAFDPDAIAGVEVRPGALPASFGDRLSGVVAARTRDGGRDSLRWSGGLGLISARLAVDGPLPGKRGSFWVSGRRSYLDAVIAAAELVGVVEAGLPYSLSDVHAKVTHDLGGGGRISATAYLNGEGFSLPRDWEVGDVDWRWGSRVAGVEYRQPLGGELLLLARASLSHFDARLRDSLETFARSSQEDRSASLSLSRVGRSSVTSAGARVDAYRLSHHVLDRGPYGIGVFLPGMQRDDEPLTAAFHLSQELRPTRRLSVEAGMRLLAARGARAVWMPRLGVRYRLREGLAVTAGGGRYAQAVHTVRDEESRVAGIFAFDLLGGAAGDPSVADDAVLGLEWSSDAAELRLEAYTRRFRRLPLAPLAIDPDDSPALVAGEMEDGRGWARGLELFAQRRGERASVTLAYAWSLASRTVGGEEFAPRYHQLHALDASATLRLRRGLTLVGRTLATSGQPYTPVVGAHATFVLDPVTGQYVNGAVTALYGEHNSERLPGYLRLDLALRGSLERRWLGRRASIVPYASVLNVLGRKNVLWVTPRVLDSRVEWTRESQLPILPTVGIEWRF